MSFADRLRDDLSGVEADLMSVLDNSQIRGTGGAAADGVLVVMADYDWERSADNTVMQRMRVLDRLRSCHRRLLCLFPHPTPDVSDRIAQNVEAIKRWLERPNVSDYSIPPTIEQAKKVASSWFVSLAQLLFDVSADSVETINVVPDTNALLRNPSLASYSEPIGTDRFTFHIVTTVMRELDDLKDRGRTPEVRDKAEGVVRRLKGLRDRGSLNEGVKVQGNIRLRLAAQEPDVRASIEGLDPSVPDDRIIAAALEIQARQPGATVVLVTSDLNLQNKADAVGLACAETPSRPESKTASLEPSVSLRPREAGGELPVAELANGGPVLATDIEFSVGAPESTTVVRFTAGPWHIDRLEPGEKVGYEMYGFFPQEVEATVTWSDTSGKHKKTWSIHFPDRP